MSIVVGKQYRITDSSKCSSNHNFSEGQVVTVERKCLFGDYYDCAGHDTQGRELIQSINGVDLEELN